ncbi:MAG TPA: membrane protein insertase YidC [Anaerolineales bacterium]|jgi:YidC/Oxa1 family membrane protein insertase|nr:membrane protein insertase YidC [Anaerolineales bacterium]HQX15551.1 membrane protein insertase YidC [Anaerolineales bacterium]
MKNPGNQTQAQRPELPKGFATETVKTIAVIAILVLAFTNFSAVINFVVNILIFIYTFVGKSFGIAIILLTVLIRLITWPLNAQQMKGAKAMQDMQNDKDWLAIQKKYAKDREKLAQEQMRVYREKGINPFGSCLPTLIQFPILFALIPSITYAIGSTPLSILKLSNSLYSFQDVASLVPLNSKFLWIDLGLPERTIIFGVGIPILALTVALTTYIQSKLTMPVSSTPGDQSAATARMMSIYMPVMLFLFSVNYASGLSIYFVASNILSIVQYALMGKVNWRNLLPGGQKS